MRKIFFLPLLLLTACSLQTAPQPVATGTPTSVVFSTATLVPTFTPRPVATTAIPTIAPTIAPILGSLTMQVNVRSGPDKKMISLGLLNYGSQVQVIGKNSGAEWFQIIYPQNSTTTGWVSADYVQLPEGESGKIPVVEYVSSQDPTPAAGETPAPPVAVLTPTPAAQTASVTKQIFVRKGPGQVFDSLGMIDAGTQVTLTGRSQTNVWVQILFAGGVDGKAWVAAAYLSGADLRGLPYYDNQGNLLSGSTPPLDPNLVTITATAFSPAVADGDSEQNPAVRLKFAPDSAREFTFSSDLSSPNGDTTDWVAFTPYEPTNQSTYLYLKLECSGNGGITAVLEKDGLPVPEMKPLVCGNYDFAIHVLGGQEYSLVLNADGSGSSLRYVSYTLYVNSEP